MMIHRYKCTKKMSFIRMLLIIIMFTAMTNIPQTAECRETLKYDSSLINGIKLKYMPEVGIAKYALQRKFVYGRSVIPSSQYFNTLTNRNLHKGLVFASGLVYQVEHFQVGFTSPILSSRGVFATFRMLVN